MNTLPQEIEKESFRLILADMGAHSFSPEELAIVVRVIHATADFDFRETIRFHPQAVRAGVTALRRGCTIIADVRMVEVGISVEILSRLGGRTICDVRHPQVCEEARALGLTRSAVAIRRNARHIQGSIVAVGNAPTALLEVIRLVREEGIHPALIIGVPVGFVNAAESKEELLTLDVPYITTLGRKGGSPVAVAIVNALLRLASYERDDG